MSADKEILTLAEAIAVVLHIERQHPGLDPNTAEKTLGPIEGGVYRRARIIATKAYSDARQRFAEQYERAQAEIAKARKLLP